MGNTQAQDVEMSDDNNNNNNNNQQQQQKQLGKKDPRRLLDYTKDKNIIKIISTHAAFAVASTQIASYEATQPISCIAMLNGTLFSGAAVIPSTLKNYNEIRQCVKKLEQEVNQQINSDFLIQYIPFAIVHGRFLPAKAAALLLNWVNLLEQQESADARNATVYKNLDAAAVSKIKRVLQFQEAYGEASSQEFDNFISTPYDANVAPQPHVSYMAEKFKPYPSFPSVKLDAINKILKAANQSTIGSMAELNTLEAYYELLNRLEALLGVNKDDSFVKFIGRKRRDDYSSGRPKPKTLVAVYKHMGKKQRKVELHKSLHHHRAYNRALLVCGRLRGRLETFFSPYITSLCARIDKSGFATLYNGRKELNINQGSDFLSILWLSLTVALNSVRKAFTLDSQMQGGLNVVQQYIMKMLQESPSTRWDMIASVHPLASVFEKMEEASRQPMFAECLRYHIPLARFLEKQWNAGVRNCAMKKMMVPRSGTTSVDSAGWNAAAGAWNNLLRFIRSISASMSSQQSAPLITKVMKLTAADQMQWADAVGKADEVDVPVFCNLALNHNITGWNIVLGRCFVSEDLIKQVCTAEKCDPKRWLAAPKERTVDMKVHGDMICGCSVSGGDWMYMQILKSLGAYGYRQFKQ